MIEESNNFPETCVEELRVREVLAKQLTYWLKKLFQGVLHQYFLA